MGYRFKHYSLTYSNEINGKCLNFQRLLSQLKNTRSSHLHFCQCKVPGELRVPSLSLRIIKNLFQQTIYWILQYLSIFTSMNNLLVNQDHCHSQQSPSATHDSATLRETQVSGGLGVEIGFLPLKSFVH